MLFRSHNLKKSIAEGIHEHAVVEHLGNEIYAYEVDGLGNSLLIDDPNVPSLLSAPYLGFCDMDDPLYLNTRKHILSEENEYYYTGEFARGCGSSHTPVWYI